jgi:peptidoglycan/xylan/chitin deacetylase (PgdA/CDA1 family)
LRRNKCSKGWLALFGMLFFCCLPLGAAAEERQAVVLMYHHFGVDKYPSTNVRLAQFEAHLDYLATAGYEVWPLTRVVEYVLANKPFPARVVAITIDDAYLSVYEQAYPRLRARGWPFTVFVATDGVDRHFKAYMSWQQLREMQQHGATLANHSASHDYLIRQRPDENQAQWLGRLEQDIDRAQRRLTEELGQAPMLFAYPYGEYNTAVAALVKRLGYVAFGQQSGPVGLGSDTRVLPRFPMAERFAALADFQQKIASLAFPLQSVQPWDPVLRSATSASEEERAPSMVVRLADSDARLAQLSCFVSGQGSVPVKWLDRQQREFVVQAPAALGPGRSRYNCTAPSSQPGRYYWFSHLWIRP